MAQSHLLNTDMTFENSEITDTTKPAQAENALQDEWLSHSSVKSSKTMANRETQDQSIDNGFSITNTSEQAVSVHNRPDRDLRKTIIHLAEYDHCRFTDRNEYAQTIDGLFKDFTQRQDVQAGMKELQKLVAGYMQNPNRESLASFYRGFQALSSARTRDSLAHLAKLEETTRESSSTQERQAAEKDLTSKQNDFHKDLDKLPQAEKDRILCLLDWQDDVSRDVRNERVRSGLKDNPEILAKFNEMLASEERRDSLKSPEEKQLYETHRQNVRDNVLARAILKLAIHRHQINTPQIPL